ncbi:protein O-mannosyl-transferase TMTC4 isoform X2 [Hydra vulgaris]|uniref:dolichyl-phosphate-mannose--protein mannosyltransferase n=1 Tax=Hydra vulgaris TaxID=6087 RepID=A0ABM4B899_HYDVU
MLESKVVNKDKKTLYLSLNDNVLPVPVFSFFKCSVIVAFVSVCCFWVTQWGDFTFDDNSAILLNEDIRSHTSVWQVFQNDFWGTSIRSNISHKSYRPLTVLSFKLDYFLAGGYKPWGFHLVNIVLHTINSIFILQVFSVLFGGIRISSDGRKIFTSPKASLLCGILFAIHPIHTESVAAIVGRADLLCCTSFILSFLCYSKHCYLDNGTWKYFLMSIILCAVSMFFKEQGITILGVCVGYELVMIMKLNNIDNICNISQQKSLKRILLLTIWGLGLLLFRIYIMSSSLPNFSFQDNPGSFQKSLIVRVYNYIYHYSINIWLLLSPHWLCFDWAMGCIPIVGSLTDLRLFAPMFMILCFSSICLKTLLNLKIYFMRCFAMGVIFMVVPFLPSTNIFFRVGFVIAERNLYIPSIGFLMLVVLGTVVLCSTVRLKMLVAFFWKLLIIIFFLKSYNRASKWLNEMDLFTSGLEVCPLNAKVHYNIGKVNQDKGNLDEAIKAYHEAIRLDSSYDQPLNNLGNIYKEKNMLQEAEHYLQMAVNVSSSFSTAWMNLGAVKADLKKKEESINCYKKATTLKKNYPDAYYNWGNLYLGYREYDQAMDKFNMAIKLQPTHLKAWQNKIILLGDLGNVVELNKCGKKILELFPLDDEMLYIVGNALGKAEDLKTSEHYLEKALAINPTHANAIGNLGVIYHRLKNYPKAYELYVKSLQLNPNSEFTTANLKKLLNVYKKL